MKTHDIPKAIFEAVDGTEENIEPVTIDGHVVNRRIKRIAAIKPLSGELGWLRLIFSADGSHRVEGVELYTSRADAVNPALEKVSPKCVTAFWYNPDSYYQGERILRRVVDYAAAIAADRDWAKQPAFILISYIVLLAEKFDHEVKRGS